MDERCGDQGEIEQREWHIGIGEAAGGIGAGDDEVGQGGDISGSEQDEEGDVGGDVVVCLLFKKCEGQIRKKSLFSSFQRKWENLIPPKTSDSVFRRSPKLIWLHVKPDNFIPGLPIIFGATKHGRRKKYNAFFALFLLFNPYQSSPR